MQIFESFPRAVETVDNMIVISGVPRSGTTLVGKIIGSAANVEYSFEPPTGILLISLLADPALADPQRSAVGRLFESYVHADILLELVAGRRLNFVEADDSYCGNYYSQADIAERLSDSSEQRSMEPAAVKRRLALKVPGTLPYLGEFGRRYPNPPVVVVLRDPEATLSSLVRRDWFSLSALRRRQGIWPDRLHDEVSIPVCLPRELDDWWVSADASPYERAAQYLLAQWSPLRASADSLIVLDYDALVDRPVERQKELFAELDIEATDLTRRHLAAIVPRPAAGGLLEELGALGTQLRDLHRELRGYAIGSVD